MQARTLALQSLPQRIFLIFQSNSKLPQMMIDVQITPAHPISLRHFSKQRMALPFESSMRVSYPLNHRHERIQVAFEIFRRRSTLLLIILSHGAHTMRPLERSVQSDPPDRRARQQVALVAMDLSFTNHALE